MAYHYIESGLDNIWLANGYTIHSTPYGEGVSIQDTAGLHRAIGQSIIDTPKPINGAELRFIRLEMEMTQKGLAAVLGEEEQTVRRWEKARNKPIRGSADRLIRVLYNEFLNGDGSIRAQINRLVELDQIEQQKMVFCDTDSGWQPQLAYAA